MKILKKTALGILLILVIAAAGGYAYLRHVANRGVPEYRGQVALKNLEAPVTDAPLRHFFFFTSNCCFLKNGFIWPGSEDRFR